MSRQSPLNYYDILGIPQGTTDSNIINSAYKRLSLQYHPDKNVSKTPAERRDAAAMFLKISDARQNLLDSLEKGNSVHSYQPRKKEEVDLNGLRDFQGIAKEILKIINPDKTNIPITVLNHKVYIGENKPYQTQKSLNYEESHIFSIALGLIEKKQQLNVAPGSIKQLRSTRSIRSFLAEKTIQIDPAYGTWIIESSIGSDLFNQFAKQLAVSPGNSIMAIESFRKVHSIYCYFQTQYPEMECNIAIDEKGEPNISLKMNYNAVYGDKGMGTQKEAQELRKIEREIKELGINVDFSESSYGFTGLTIPNDNLLNALYEHNQAIFQDSQNLHYAKAHQEELIGSFNRQLLENDLIENIRAKALELRRSGIDLKSLRNEKSPLKIAVSNKVSLDVVKFLIEEEGLNPFEQYQSSQGKTTLFIEACKHCDLDVVKYLYQKTNPTLFETGHNEETALHSAIRYAQHPFMPGIPFLNQAYEERIAVIEFLIKSGAPLDAKDYKARTPIQLASHDYMTLARTQKIIDLSQGTNKAEADKNFARNLAESQKQEKLKEVKIKLAKFFKDYFRYGLHVCDRDFSQIEFLFALEDKDKNREHFDVIKKFLRTLPRDIKDMAFRHFTKKTDEVDFDEEAFIEDLEKNHVIIDQNIIDRILNKNLGYINGRQYTMADTELEFAVKNFAFIFDVNLPQNLLKRNQIYQNRILKLDENKALEYYFNSDSAYADIKLAIEQKNDELAIFLLENEERIFDFANDKISHAEIEKKYFYKILLLELYLKTSNPKLELKYNELRSLDYQAITTVSIETNARAKTILQNCEKVFRPIISIQNARTATIPEILASATYADEEHAAKTKILRLYQELFAVESLKPLMTAIAYACLGKDENGDINPLKIFASSKIIRNEEGFSGGSYDPIYNAIYLNVGKIIQDSYLARLSEQQIKGAIIHEMHHAWEQLKHRKNCNPEADVSALLNEAQAVNHLGIAMTEPDPKRLPSAIFNISMYPKDRHDGEIVVRTSHAIAAMTGMQKPRGDNFEERDSIDLLRTKFPASFAYFLRETQQMQEYNQQIENTLGRRPEQAMPIPNIAVAAVTPQTTSKDYIKLIQIEDFHPDRNQRSGVAKYVSTGNSVIVDPAGTAFTPNRTQGSPLKGGAASGAIYRVLNELNLNYRPTEYVGGVKRDITHLQTSDAVLNNTIFEYSSNLKQRRELRDEIAIIHVVGPNISAYNNLSPRIIEEAFAKPLTKTLFNAICAWQFNPEVAKKDLYLPLISAGVFGGWRLRNYYEIFINCLNEAINLYEKENDGIDLNLVKRIHICPGNPDLAIAKEEHLELTEAKNNYRVNTSLIHTQAQSNPAKISRKQLIDLYCENESAQKISLNLDENSEIEIKSIGSLHQLFMNGELFISEASQECLDFLFPSTRKFHGTNIEPLNIHDVENLRSNPTFVKNFRESLMILFDEYFPNRQEPRINEESHRKLLRIVQSAMQFGFTREAVTICNQISENIALLESTGKHIEPDVIAMLNEILASLNPSTKKIIVTNEVASAKIEPEVKEKETQRTLPKTARKTNYIQDVRIDDFKSSASGKCGVLKHLKRGGVIVDPAGSAFKHSKFQTLRAKTGASRAIYEALDKLEINARPTEGKQEITELARSQAIFNNTVYAYSTHLKNSAPSRTLLSLSRRPKLENEIAIIHAIGPNISNHQNLSQEIVNREFIAPLTEAFYNIILTWQFTEEISQKDLYLPLISAGSFGGSQLPNYYEIYINCLNDAIAQFAQENSINGQELAKKITICPGNPNQDIAADEYANLLQAKDLIARNLQAPAVNHNAWAEQTLSSSASAASASAASANIQYSSIPTRIEPRPSGPRTLYDTITSQEIIDFYGNKNFKDYLVFFSSDIKLGGIAFINYQEFYNYFIDQLKTRQLDRSEIEFSHDFIQIMFPSYDRGTADNIQPLDRAHMTLLQGNRAKNEEVKGNLRNSFNLMMAFYGLEINYDKNGHIKIDFEQETLNNPRRWQALSKNDYDKNSLNHNHLRMTRILKSLKIFGLDEEHDAFKDFLFEAVLNKQLNVSNNTLDFWFNMTRADLEAQQRQNPNLQQPRPIQRQFTIPGAASAAWHDGDSIVDDFADDSQDAHNVWEERNFTQQATISSTPRSSVRLDLTDQNVINLQDMKNAGKPPERK